MPDTNVMAIKEIVSKRIISLTLLIFVYKTNFWIILFCKKISGLVKIPKYGITIPILMTSKKEVIDARKTKAIN